MTAISLSKAASARRAFGWYPLVLSLVWFLQVLTEAEVELAPAIRPLVAFIVVPVCLTVVCIWILGRERGTLLAAIAVVALITVRSPVMALPLIALVPILLVERRWSDEGRLRLPWPRIHEALTILVAVLLVVQLGRLLILPTAQAAAPPDAWSGQPIAGGSRPDIYLVLADAHGRADVLADTYGHDSHEFLGDLTSLGFDVASQSRANYLLTRFSLGSMFTSSYLSQLNELPNRDAMDRFARETVKQNPAFWLLRRAGYEVNVISSGYEHLGLRGADTYVDTGQPNEFETMVMQNVAASQLADVILPGWEAQATRDRTTHSLAALLAITRAEHDRPQFTFVHLPVPHLPFVFDDACRHPSTAIAVEDFPRGALSPDKVLAIGAQTKCVERMLLATITNVVHEDPDAAVIVFSDHGPHVDLTNPDPTEIDERSAILFAARTPGKDDVFPDDISLVNVLPTLFNEYLGTELPHLPTEVWFGPASSDGRFIEVTTLP